MAVLEALVAPILNLLGGLTSKLGRNSVEKRFERFITALYKIGEGKHSVSLDALQDYRRFSELDAFSATTRGEELSMLTRTSAFGRADEWILTQRGCQYAKALSEKKHG